MSDNSLPSSAWERRAWKLCFPDCEAELREVGSQAELGNQISAATTTENNNTMQKITPFLWFDGKAEEAASFYTSIFKNSKIVSTMRYGEAGPGPKGSVMSATFELDGQEFIALNGGPHFTFSPAISFFINCDTQHEIDHFWEKLSAGGKKDRCGCLTDKFGDTWQ